MTNDTFRQMICGDSREALPTLSEAFFHAVVTDPPYALGSLNDAGWDSQVAFDTKLWANVLRTLKPGGWLLSFGGSRTYHRMACAVEDAGFEIHDKFTWLYSEGFPRGKDPAKAIAAAGGDPEAWEGWGTCLKPASESIVLARRPREGTVAKNVVKHGSGLLNIDGNRIGEEKRYNPPARNKADGRGPYLAGKYGMPQGVEGKHVVGRHPANVIIDDVVAEIDPHLARYFYVAKATNEERKQAANHPTLKPVALMRHLVRLVTPPGGRVLDPFTGAGSTGVACMEEGFSFRGIELDPDFATAALTRMRGHCYDCGDSGLAIVAPGGQDYPPEYEPCWCPKAIELLETRGYTKVEE